VRAFLGFVRKETLHLLRDRQTLAILLLFPVVQVLVFGFAIRATAIGFSWLTSLTVGAAAPLQEAGVVALDLPESYYTELALHYAERRDWMLQMLACAGFLCTRPRGAYYVMADFSKLSKDDDVTFARHLIEAKRHSGAGMIRVVNPSDRNVLAEVPSEYRNSIREIVGVVEVQIDKHQVPGAAAGEAHISADPVPILGRGRVGARMVLNANLHPVLGGRPVAGRDFAKTAGVKLRRRPSPRGRHANHVRSETHGLSSLRNH